MTRKEYQEGLARIGEKVNELRKALDDEYVLSNTDIKIGDVVTEGRVRIKVTRMTSTKTCRLYPALLLIGTVIDAKGNEKGTETHIVREV